MFSLPRQIISFSFSFNKDDNFVLRLTSNFFQKSSKFLLFLILVTNVHNLKFMRKKFASFITTGFMSSIAILPAKCCG
jgi:hypothetical protein